jgi:hypothetical protein
LSFLHWRVLPPKVCPPRTGIPLSPFTLFNASGTCGWAAYAMSQSKGVRSPPMAESPGFCRLPLIPCSDCPPLPPKEKFYPNLYAPPKPTRVNPPPRRKPRFPPVLAPIIRIGKR